MNTKFHIRRHLLLALQITSSQQVLQTVNAPCTWKSAKERFYSDKQLLVEHATKLNHVTLYVSLHTFA